MGYWRKNAFLQPTLWIGSFVLAMLVIAVGNMLLLDVLRYRQNNDSSPFKLSSRDLWRILSHGNTANVSSSTFNADDNTADDSGAMYHVVYDFENNCDILLLRATTTSTTVIARFAYPDDSIVQFVRTPKEIAQVISDVVHTDHRELELTDLVKVRSRSNARAALEPVIARSSLRGTIGLFVEIVNRGRTLHYRTIATKQRNAIVLTLHAPKRRIFRFANGRVDILPESPCIEPSLVYRRDYERYYIDRLVGERHQRNNENSSEDNVLSAFEWICRSEHDRTPTLRLRE